MKNRKNKKLRLRKEAKEFLRNALGVALFYLVIIGGVLLIDYRFKNDEQTKSADVVAIQTAQNNS